MGWKSKKKLKCCQNELKSKITFHFSMACDCKGIGCQRGLNFWVVKMDDLTILFDHIYLYKQIMTFTQPQYPILQINTHFTFLTGTINNVVKGRVL